MDVLFTFQEELKSETKNLYQEIRKNSAQHDSYNRLHSIQHDIAFVRKVAEEWYDSAFKVVANQRCGSWYTDPEAPSTSSSTYAYFKSTDGHTNAWDFSVRRSNLSLIDFAVQQGGFIIVDSTRRGKRMPDALSKTIPIWCTVINRAVLRSNPELEKTEWNTQLYTPPNIVSAQEKSQIEERIEGWVDNLVKSSLTIPNLPRPLRPIFIHPGTSYPPTLPLPSASRSSTSPLPPPFIPIICLSASTFIPHGGPEPKRDAYGTFEYVQGSGDDDELWGKGLKPGHFFRNREEILSASREELPELIARLVERGQSQAGTASATQGLDVWKEIPRGSKIWLGTTLSELPTDLGSYASITFELSDKPSIETVNSNETSPGLSQPKHLVLRLQEGKKKKTDLDYATQVLPAVVDFARRVRSHDPDTHILVRDPTGKSLSVGAAVCLSWLFVQSDRLLRPIINSKEDGGSEVQPVPTPTKEDLRKRLEWILDERQGVNPSRHVLKAVNEYLISAKYK